MLDMSIKLDAPKLRTQVWSMPTGKPPMRPMHKTNHSDSKPAVSFYVMPPLLLPPSIAELEQVTSELCSLDDEITRLIQMRDAKKIQLAQLLARVH